MCFRLFSLDIGLGAKDVSEMTQEEIAAWLDNDEYEEEDKRKKKKKKKERSPKQQVLILS